MKQIATITIDNSSGNSGLIKHLNDYRSNNCFVVSIEEFEDVIFVAFETYHLNSETHITTILESALHDFNDGLFQLVIDISVTYFPEKSSLAEAFSYSLIEALNSVKCSISFDVVFSTS